MPPPPPGPAVQPTGTPDEQGLKSDANQDHAWYLPTAETVPGGSFVFTDWELLLAGVKYGATNNLELSAETLVPITTDIPFLLLLGAKLRVVKTDNLRVAVNANVLYTSASGDHFTMGEVGAAASLCLDSACHSLLTGGMQIMFGINTTNSSGAFVFVPTASFIGRLGRHVKALIEVDSAGYHANGDTQLARGALVMYGLRFYSREIAADIGFARPLCSDGCSTGSLLLGVPLVTFSYRFE